ncbi:hypothetical protein HDU97_004130 [Phlyctochytrium planicorne]|nr:hypothetical protein HDU97_004130 [Phlyctochytrium planicorne]
MSSLTGLPATRRSNRVAAKSHLRASEMERAKDVEMKKTRGRISKMQNKGKGKFAKAAEHLEIAAKPNLSIRKIALKLPPIPFSSATDSKIAVVDSNKSSKRRREHADPIYGDEEIVDIQYSTVTHIDTVRYEKKYSAKRIKVLPPVAYEEAIVQAEPSESVNSHSPVNQATLEHEMALTLIGFGRNDGGQSLEMKSYPTTVGHFGSGQASNEAMEAAWALLMLLEGRK